MSRQFIDKTLLTDYRIITFDGVDLISRYALFTSVITNALGEKTAEFLAEPVKRPNSNELNWYTSVEGQAVPLERLSDEDKDRLLAQKDALVADLNLLASQLEASAVGSRSLAGILLNLIFKEPGSYRLFSVSGQPVLVGWGLSSLSSGYGADALNQKEPEPAEASGEQSVEANNLTAIKSIADSSSDLSSTSQIDEIDKKERKKRKERIDIIDSKSEKKTFFQRIGILGSFLIGLGALLILLLSLFLFSVFFASVSGLNQLETIIETNDISNMEGCWDSISDALVDNRTNLPVIYTYCFDKEGVGDITIEKKDRDGNYLDTCTTKAVVEIVDKKLIINVNEPVYCQINNTFYIEHKIICSNENNNFACQVFQKDFDELVYFNFERRK